MEETKYFVTRFSKSNYSDKILSSNTSISEMDEAIGLSFMLGKHSSVEISQVSGNRVQLTQNSELVFGNEPLILNSPNSEEPPFIL